MRRFYARSAVLGALFLALFGSAIISQLSAIETVVEAAREYIIWLVLVPLISVFCYVLDGIFIGAGKFKQLRNGMLISTFIVFLPMWFIFQPLGNHGLWWALFCFNLSRGVTLGVSFYNLHKRDGWIN